MEHYIASLEFLNRFDDAFTVMTKAIETQKLQKTADRMYSAAYYLVSTNKREQATTFYRDAVALGKAEAQIQLTENLIILSEGSNNRDCKTIESESIKSTQSGWSMDLANQFIANCYFGRAEDHMKETCETKRKPKLTDSAKAEIEISKTYLREINPNSSEYQRANKWLTLYDNKKILRTFICSEYNANR